MIFVRPFGSLVALCVLFCPFGASGQSSNPKVILISMDSLMYKFIADAPVTETEHFRYMVRNGVLLKEMLNVFPTSTYPNHYTLLTGLYPESHGMVGNRFYDPDLQEYFEYTIPEHNLESRWYDVGAEPIYVTNSKAGGNRRSGSLLFPTGLARVKGIAPDMLIENDGTYPKSYNGYYDYPYVNMSYSDRIDRLITWFTDSQQPINLGLLYFPEPDEQAHVHGPNSAEVRAEITGPLNKALGYLFSKLREHKLLDSTNIILTSDHGHTRRSGLVQLDDYLDLIAFTTGGRFKDTINTGILPGAGELLTASIMLG